MTGKTKTIEDTKALIKDATEFLESIGGGTSLPGDELNQAVRAIMSKEKITSYSEALQLALADDPGLAKQYAEQSYAITADDGDDRQGAGETIDRMVREMIRTDSTLDYESALSRVLLANPWLAETYGRSRAAG